jgi:hypothetical protein
LTYWHIQEKGQQTKQMGKPIPYLFREKIVRERASGKSYAQIVQDLGYAVSEIGARKICAAFKKSGDASLSTRYDRCGRRSPYEEGIRDRIEALRRGSRGAPYIKSLLSDQGGDCPSERSIQRWWRASGTQKPKAGRTKAEKALLVDPHDVWEVDGKEQMAIQNGEKLSWMNIADKASGAALGASLFPLGPGGHPRRESRAANVQPGI